MFGNERRASVPGRLRPAAVPFRNRKFKIKNYEIGAPPAEDAHDCKELRASAAPRLRPARS